ncbi:hypothetical protein AAVH_21325 [Aphelenchoides avenae]|nr:hypothetical protein AAVH_21325 [Aphelenchus avenae]
MSYNATYAKSAPKRKQEKAPSKEQPAKRPKREAESSGDEEEAKEIALWKLAYWKYALIKFKCNGCRERDWANREKNIKVLEDGYTRTFDDYCPTCRDANIAMTNVYYARFKAAKKDDDNDN